jgi:hypothetical protein
MSVPFIPPVGPPFIFPGPVYVSKASSLFPNEGPTVAPPSVIPPAAGQATVLAAPSNAVNKTSYVPYQVSELQTQQLFSIVDSNTQLINTPQPNPIQGT